MAKPAQPFRYRDGWRIQVTLDNGKRPSKDFAKHADAVQWAADTLSPAKNGKHAPELGGPTKATLAQALAFYAEHHSLLKGGVDAELNRINHYLEGAGQPLLKAVVNAKGGRELARHTPTAQPDAWQQHNDRRRTARAATYAAIRTLANRRCSEISSAHIRALHTQMSKDGLSASTIQKEIAMLKTMFNTAATEWAWKGFENPCSAIKLGKSERHFVYLEPAQHQALGQALAECDNPYFWPLVIAAKETTLRLDTLMRMRWDKVDVENRITVLPSKSGQRNYVLPLTVQEVLRALPRSPTGRVFPMSKNAVKMAWNRVREKAQVPGLQFRDLRHLGATDWARRGLTAHELQQVLGHSNIQTAQYYIDLVGRDIQGALDRASTKASVPQLPEAGQCDTAEQIRRKRAERMREVTAKRVAQLQHPHDAAPSPVDAPASVNSVGNTVPDVGQAGKQRADPSVGRAAARDEASRPSNVVPFRPRKAA